MRRAQLIAWVLVGALLGTQGAARAQAPSPEAATEEMRGSGEVPAVALTSAVTPRRSWLQPLGIALASLGVGTIFVGAPMHRVAVGYNREYRQLRSDYLTSGTGDRAGIEEWGQRGQSFEYAGVGLVVFGALALAASVVLLLYEPWQRLLRAGSDAPSATAASGRTMALTDRPRSAPVP